MSSEDFYLEELRGFNDQIFDNKASLETKANYIITISGAVAALLFTIAGFVFDKLGPTYEQVFHVGIFLITSIGLNIIAIGLCSRAFGIKPYSFPMMFTNLGNRDTVQLDSVEIKKRITDKPTTNKAMMTGNYIQAINENITSNIGKSRLIWYAQWFFLAGIVLMIFPLLIIFVFPHLDKSINIAPMADAGQSQYVLENKTVRLDSSLSKDIDGHIMNYRWEQTRGPIVNLINYTAPSPTFVAPNTTDNTDLEFRLTLTDNNNSTAIDTTTVLVEPDNKKPIAYTLPTVVVTEGMSETIKLQGYDQDQDLLGFKIIRVPKYGNLSDIIRFPNNTAEVIYTPISGFSGNDSFTYKALDDISFSNEASVPIKVEHVSSGKPIKIPTVHHVPDGSQQIKTENHIIQ